MQFLDFEEPLEALYDQLEKIKQVGEKGEVDLSATIKELENKIKNKRKDIYSNLTGWQKVQLSRHPERPYTCLLYTSPSPRDRTRSRMPSSA